MARITIRPKNLDSGVQLSLPAVPNGGAYRRPLTVPYDETQLKGMLMRFDTDGDGRLSKKELREAFKKLGSRAPAFRTFSALFHADRNKDGHINDDELDVLVKFVKKCGYTVK